jgi:Arc/MetJ family transcription regulator
MNPYHAERGFGKGGGNPEIWRKAGNGRLDVACWIIEPYFDGIIVCMKKTLNIDDELFEQAKSACGAGTDTETVRLGLEALVRHAAYERLRALRGTEPHAQDVPRRREGPTRRHKSA